MKFAAIPRQFFQRLAGQRFVREYSLILSYTDEYSILLLAIAEGDKPGIHIFSILDILKGGCEWTRVCLVEDSP